MKKMLLFLRFVLWEYASRLARFRILCCFLPALFRLLSRRRPSVCTAASQKKGDVSYCFVPLFRCPPLAQHMDITVMSTCYFRQHCVVVGQRCHRIASLLRLVLTGISSTHYCNINATLYWEAAGGGACRLFPILVFLFTRLLLVGNNIIIHSLQKKYPFGSKS